MLSFLAFYCTGSHRVKRKSHKRRRSAFWREWISSTIAGSCWRGKKYLCQKNDYVEILISKILSNFKFLPWWGCFEFVWLLTSCAFRQVISCKPGRSGVSNMVQFQIGMLLAVTYRCFLTKYTVQNVFETDSKGPKQNCRDYGGVHISQRSRIQQFYIRWFLWGLAVCCPKHCPGVLII